ncbi:MAG: Gfo/Idh/MocA family oxidoreductase [Planctomycetota bacterium]|nr:MAG: Gfo/Idh/MocA family oxidoreductase [Planctomycetota bacterium]
MTETSLRVGFVGGGFITRFHIHSLTAVRGVEVAGVASRTRKVAQEAADLAREVDVGAPRVFADAESMAADPALDALWLCTPNDTRIPVLEAVARGNARRAAPLRGIACEKPLGRTLAEARRLAAIAAAIGVPTGYLEDMVFAPHLRRGKEVIWRRAVPLAGRPYIARAAEEHGGPHMPWFWQGRRSGGGTLLDMMCHSLEAARWLLTEPGAPRSSLTPTAVLATTARLKWAQLRFAKELRERTDGAVDMAKEKTEDFARATVIWRTAAGQEILTETSSSWSYVSAGLKHTFELLGPEYSLRADLSRTGLEVFLSRRVTGPAGEDLVEKQNAEQGLMPIAPDETALYGYQGENRHFVTAFRDGTPPELGFADGVEVMRLLMASYLSAETGCSVDPANPELESYVPPAMR